MHSSVSHQVKRLLSAGYPLELITSVAESALKKSKSEPATRDGQGSDNNRKRVAVIPYLHGISHSLKKVGKKAGVDVVFSAPDRLAGLCRSVNEFKGKVAKCTTKHQSRFVPCDKGVVYNIPLPCGGQYVGQTGRCINKRLSEHSYKVSKVVSGHLGIHCRDCEWAKKEKKQCVPLYHETKVIAKNREKTAREIIEAYNIFKQGNACISTPSLTLLQKELSLLGVDNLC